MEKINERVTLRFDREKVKAADEIIRKNPEFSSRSEFYRKAVQSYIERLINKEEKGTDDVTIQVPTKMLEFIDSQIDEGYYLSRQDAIVDILRKYLTKDKIREIRGHQKEMDLASGRTVAVSLDQEEKTVLR